MRKIFSVVLLLASVGAAHAAPIGMAESPAGFSVAKAVNGKTINVPGSTVVDAGDEIAASGQVVRVQLPKGDQLLVDRNSTATFVSDSEVALNKGNMMATLGQSSSREFTYEGLSIQSVPADPKSTAADASPSQGVLVVSQVDQDTVKVAGMNSEYVVADKANDKRVAYLGSGDAMQFHHDGQEWVLQQQQMQSPFSSPTDVTEGALTVDVEKVGALWWSVPIVAVGAGVGGYYGYYLLDDLLDNNKNSNDGGDDEGDDGGSSGGGDETGGSRPPSTATFPTPTPAP